MQVTNPLVPPSPGQPGGASAPVANAPAAPDVANSETSRPVTASRESADGRNEAQRRPEENERPPTDSGRGGNLDVRV